CIGLCGLSEQEVEAISEHEHIPEIAAAAMAQYLLNQPHGRKWRKPFGTSNNDEIRRGVGKRHGHEHQRLPSSNLDLILLVNFDLDLTRRGGRTRKLLSHPSAKVGGMLPPGIQEFTTFVV